jgi:hypothetical protein
MKLFGLKEKRKTVSTLQNLQGIRFEQYIYPFHCLHDLQFIQLHHDGTCFTVSWPVTHLYSDSVTHYVYICTVLYYALISVSFCIQWRKPLLRRTLGTSYPMFFFTCMKLIFPVIAARSHPQSARYWLHLANVLSTSRLHRINISFKSRLHLIHISATSHPRLGYFSSKSRLGLIKISATSHLHLAYVMSTSWLGLIHISARSHPHLGHVSSTVS